jgi:hypothetical protein
VQSENPLFALLALGRQTRAAAPNELPFLLVNEARVLVEYRQAALWLEAGGVFALSGLAQPELNAPYVQWLERLCAAIAIQHPSASAVITSRDVAPELAEQWGEWLPAFLLWIPIANVGAVLFVRETFWDESNTAFVKEWSEIWGHAWLAQQTKSAWSFSNSLRNIKNIWRTRPQEAWWQQPRVWISAALLIVLFFPVRLSVLAPAELVAAHPEVIRAPLDGVIGQFHIEPNQTVAAGQLLFEFDAAVLNAQAQVAMQALAGAETEYRQNAALAVADNRSKAQLGLLLGKIAERRAELDYLQGQIERAKVTAPHAGVAVFDDASEWIGRPVQIGERILRIADPRDVEVEAWLPLGDALIFPQRAAVQMYPSATPLHSLSGKMRYIAFEAQARPDGNYAYRLRAELDETAAARLGQKGTARIYAGRVPLIYWVVRRPAAVVRQYLGI